jgi:pyruvate/2-oxoglutarate dehydrogenase complex dihydrolipoamide acyltransferase (E2) component
MGRKYWKKRSYIMQGFVRENPLADDKTPENPIRRFIIGPQIFTLIKSALMDPELEELPTDLLRGLDFRITKTSKGGYADYNTSKWSRKESALTEAEQAALQAHGLHNLNEFLPKKPTDVELKVIKEMFEASVDGQPYDLERWGQYYRPAGVAAPAGSSNNESAAPAAAAPPPVASARPAPAAEPAAWEDDEPAVASAPVAKPAASQKAEDILAMIRSRQTK